MAKLTNLQIKISNDILKYIHEKSGRVSETDFENYCKKQNDCDRYLDALKLILEEHMLVSREGSYICLTETGKKVASKSGGIKRYVDKLEKYDDKRL